MSFALKVKEEVISHTFEDDLAKAFLSGFIKYNAELIWSSGNEKLKLSSISNKIARNIFSLCKKMFNGHIEISVSQTQTLKQNKTFQITLIGKISDFLKSLNIWDESNSKIIDFKPLKIKVKKEELTNLKRAYMAGVFVAVGSVNSPETTNYHLELQFKEELSAKYIVELMNNYGFDFKVLKRNEKLFICYIKKAIMVSDFLKFVDAYQAVMSFENERIMRDVSNNVNRVNNIDISNEKKALTTGLKQIEQISKIQSNFGMKKLSEKAVHLCDLRIQNPNASYSELTELMNENGFEITKSGISNLFKIIEKLSAEFKN
ncbi:DNA-binding protein WhiA [Mesoplasma chauliocola]|uniref:Probable cell division protein WhiA n=1 Tax=Mesoplasma chauliocola TaxID=216427 RepID=A0A249SMK4_9MOLU|nr:DNA-binding protein WhiA [Mesoplasma chauliocola]ASZ08827.1 DNA-binding protein WhiA [Mesoplasma chauliocola]